MRRQHVGADRSTYAIALAGASKAQIGCMAETFGDRLKMLREKADETQPELASVVGANTTTISRWETGAGMPHARQLIKIAAHYGVSIDHLLLGQAVGNPVTTEEFQKFLATKYGRIAVENGWVAALRSMKYPFPPTVELYQQLVNALLFEKERADR